METTGEGGIRIVAGAMGTFDIWPGFRPRLICMWRSVRHLINLTSLTNLTNSSAATILSSLLLRTLLSLHAARLHRLEPVALVPT